MGAFRDIWINNGDVSPSKPRMGNTTWEKKSQESYTLWTSKPAIVDNSISQEVETPLYHFIILGQFYEEVNSTQLLADCIKYINRESGFFSDPAGHYLLIVIEKTSGKVHLFTNRFGTYHAYWSAGRYKAISTYYNGLVQQSTEKNLDWEGIGAFLTMGFFPADKTHINSIKIFLPASCYSFDKDLNLLENRRYWDWSYDPQQLSTNEYLEQFDTILKSSLHYAVKGKDVAIPISGGLDSRVLAGIIANEDANSGRWAYSYGFTKSSPETAIARQVAQSCNIDFDKYIVPNYLFDNIELIADSVEQFQYLDGTRQAFMKKRLEEKSNVVVGGHWGDVWFNDMGVIKSGNSDEEALASAFRKKIVKKGSAKLLSLFPQTELANTGKYLDEYYNDFMNRYKHIDDIDFRFKIFKTDQWSFRWTLASIRMYQAAVMPVLPFYDKNLADLFLKIPTHIVKERNLQVEYIKQYHPALAKIKWQEYGRNLYNYKGLNNRNIIYRAFNKAKRTMSGERQIIRNGDVFYRDKNGQQQLQKLFGDNAVSQFLPQTRSKQLLDEYDKDPSAGNTYAVSMAHTIAQFIKGIS